MADLAHGLQPFSGRSPTRRSSDEPDGFLVPPFNLSERHSETAIGSARKPASEPTPETHSAIFPSGTVHPGAVSIRPWTTATPPPTTVSGANTSASVGACFVHCCPGRFHAFHVVTGLVLHTAGAVAVTRFLACREARGCFLRPGRNVAIAIPRTPASANGVRPQRTAMSSSASVCRRQRQHQHVVDGSERTLRVIEGNSTAFFRRLCRRDSG